MLCAWQTAGAVVDQMKNATIESFEALAERGLGCVANLTVSEIEAVLQQDPRYPLPPPKWKADSHYRLPLQGAESLLEAGERVADHIVARTATDGPNGTMVKVFVGHGAAFRHAAFHLGALAFERVAELSMFHGRPVLLQRDPAGRWRQVAGEWKVRPKGAEAKD